MDLTFMTRQPASIETSELRKRLRQTIEERRRITAARRQKIDAAAGAYTELLALTATPLVQLLRWELADSPRAWAASAEPVDLAQIQRWLDEAGTKPAGAN